MMGSPWAVWTVWCLVACFFFAKAEQGPDPECPECLEKPLTLHLDLEVACKPGLDCPLDTTATTAKGNTHTDPSLIQQPVKDRHIHLEIELSCEQLGNCALDSSSSSSSSASSSSSSPSSPLSSLAEETGKAVPEGIVKKELEVGDVAEAEEIDAGGVLGSNVLLLEKNTDSSKSKTTPDVSKSVLKTNSDVSNSPAFGLKSETADSARDEREDSNTELARDPSSLSGGPNGDMSFLATSQYTRLRQGQQQRKRSLTKLKHKFRSKREDGSRAQVITNQAASKISEETTMCLHPPCSCGPPPCQLASYMVQELTLSDLDSPPLKSQPSSRGGGLGGVDAMAAPAYTTKADSGRLRGPVENADLYTPVVEKKSDEAEARDRHLAARIYDHLHFDSTLATDPSTLGEASVIADKAESNHQYALEEIHRECEGPPCPFLS